MSFSVVLSSSAFLCQFHEELTSANLLTDVSQVRALLLHLARDIVKPIPLADDSESVLSAALLTGFNADVEALLVNKANLDGVEHLIHRVVYRDDLDILVGHEGILDPAVASNSFEKTTVAIRGQVELTCRFHHDLALGIHGWKHLGREEDELAFFSAEEGVVTEELHRLLMSLIRRQHEHLACAG